MEHVVRILTADSLSEEENGSPEEIMGEKKEEIMQLANELRNKQLKEGASATVLENAFHLTTDDTETKEAAKAGVIVLLEHLENQVEDPDDAIEMFLRYNLDPKNKQIQQAVQARLEKLEEDKSDPRIIKKLKEAFNVD